MLVVVTDSWTKIMRSITKYILKKRASEKNFLKNFLDISAILDIYNQWATQTGTIITDTELALWCVDYINDLMAMPFERLERSAAIDKIL